MAETLGYKPNLAARYLKSQRQYRFVVSLPEEIRAFFDALKQGIRDAAAPFEPGVTVEFHSHPQLGVGDAELFEVILEKECHGIIVAPGHPAEMKPLIRKAALKNVPVVCVATDAPGSDRITAVSADPYASGAGAAELIGRFVRQPGEIGIITGDLATVDHAQKVSGFEASLASIAPDSSIVSIIEAHDVFEQAYSQTVEILRRYPRLRAIYVNTANSLPVLKAIDETDRKDLCVITTDLFPELLPYIRSGKVVCTIYQRPFSQGRMALQALYQFVVEGRCPAPQLKLAPHFVMRSTLDLFLDFMPAESDSWTTQRSPRSTRSRP